MREGGSGETAVVVGRQLGREQPDITAAGHADKCFWTDQVLLSSPLSIVNTIIIRSSPLLSAWGTLASSRELRDFVFVQTANHEV